MKVKCPQDRNVQRSLGYHLQTHKHVFSFESLQQSTKYQHKIINILALVKMVQLSILLHLLFPPLNIQQDYRKNNFLPGSTTWG